MELVFPFILIVIGWNPDNPDETMALQHSLHSSQQVCEAKGQAFVDERRHMATGHFRAQYKYFCIAAPGPDEYEGVFESEQ